MLKKLKKVNIMTILKEHNIDEDEKILPNPFQAAIASAIAFSFDATVPLLGAAMVRDSEIKGFPSSNSATFGKKPSCSDIAPDNSFSPRNKSSKDFIFPSSNWNYYTYVVPHG